MSLVLCCHAIAQGSAVVVSVDVDEADELTDEYGVSSIPRLLFFKVRQGSYSVSFHPTWSRVVHTG